MYSQFTPSSRAPRCSVCSNPTHGQSHEMCKLAGNKGRMYVYRDTKDEDGESDIFNPACASDADSEYSYITPPPSPPKSSSGSSAWSTSERSVLSQLIPPPPKYAQSILSAASFEIPAAGLYHRVNPNFRHLVAVTQNPPSEAGTDISTEPAMSEASTVTEAGKHVRSAASPGPSAKNFLAREGSPGFGSTTNEVMKNLVLATFGRSQAVGGDPNVVPFCNDTLGRHEKGYPYWPAPQSDRVALERQRRTFRESLEELFHLRVLATVENTFQAIRDNYHIIGPYIILFVLFFLAGYFLSPYPNARKHNL